jgi:hypothetical protein
MTIDEKRAKVKEYCNSKPVGHCKYCPLENMTNCYTDVTDEEIEVNYRLIFGEDIGKDDAVNHPSHYNDGKIEVIDYIEDKNLDFCLGNAVKYISRAGKKNKDKEVEDLEKAIWYINRRIKQIERAPEAVSDV